ncbi:hypothetical protein A2714_00565 [Candidatus Woesebacteria bacterium RIFCSPHIGHO2_01_FULL_38_9]|uniref:Uncharacterized protein n=2 Tax=Candidatus Woeseibacteriota TaxID=1752722 RepID=A0A1F7Y2C2_9BACT|nr:MAG: hypothetical protein A2714_00565 [Candidatus Woesebacteria bacterium RIFCSPHIGHO2_01_FULL_38_9]OGM61065.1 MAG: hypothetical protein A3A75_02805 [Candidatus Woesebacteria bacterium RIFCSPLOWO2_01_FULL_39_10]
MTEIPKDFYIGRCASCRWWSLNFGVETPGINQAKLPNLVGTYGKCIAYYTGKDGEEHWHNEGSLGGYNCFVRDDDGNLLYEEVPVGR